VAGWWADARAAAVAEALAPFRWRDFTDRMLARRVVAAADRDVVLRFVGTIPGATAGTVGPVEPTDRGDPRVGLLVRTLEARPWRGLSLDRLCVDLIAVLAAWQADQESAAGPGGTVENR
jgi:hypothetical protein